MHSNSTPLVRIQSNTNISFPLLPLACIPSPPTIQNVWTIICIQDRLKHEVHNKYHNISSINPHNTIKAILTHPLIQTRTKFYIDSKSNKILSFSHYTTWIGMIQEASKVLQLYILS